VVGLGKKDEVRLELGPNGESRKNVDLILSQLMAVLNFNT
jgi:hypothetical protein